MLSRFPGATFHLLIGQHVEQLLNQQAADAACGYTHSAQCVCCLNQQLLELNFDLHLSWRPGSAI